MMKSLLVILFVAFASTAVADERATYEETERLIVLTNTRQILEDSVAELETKLNDNYEIALKQIDDNAEQRQILEDMQTQVKEMIRNDLKWENILPIFVDIYRKNYTRKEIYAMTAFYSSPEGQSVLSKMPGTIAYTKQSVAEYLKKIIPKVIVLQAETQQKLKNIHQPEPTF